MLHKGIVIKILKLMHVCVSNHIYRQLKKFKVQVCRGMVSPIPSPYRHLCDIYEVSLQEAEPHDLLLSERLGTQRNSVSCAPICLFCNVVHGAYVQQQHGRHE